MKNKAIVVGLTLVLVSCSASTSYSKEVNTSFEKKNFNSSLDLMDSLVKINYEKTQIEKEIELKNKKQAEIAQRNKEMAMVEQALKSQIKKLKKYVNRTYYVFSGSTPSGWDCSGLVVWYYQSLGIDLPHSANKQGHLKPKVKNPKPGDIVVFRYTNSKEYHHSGIYIGNNKVLHAGFKKGDRAEILDLGSRYFLNNAIEFVRIVKN